MKTFDEWYLELCSDERWHEQAAMNHKPETFRQVANKVYINGLAEGEQFFITPMSQHRQHVYNKVSKLPHDKVRKKWFEQTAEETKKIEEWQPVTWEERAKRLKEFQQMVDASPIMQPPVPLTARERLNQDVRPLPPDVKEPTEVQKLAALNEHIDKLNIARAKFFRDAHPDATDEEVQEYLKGFKVI